MKQTWYRFPRKAFYYRTLAFNWLRYEQGCHLITFERTPLETESRPDVLGMLRNRQLVEIEIKVDLADLRRDASKKHRRLVAQDIQRPAPGTANYVYFLVPEEMVGTALEETPTHCGVLSPNHGIRHGVTGMPTMAVHRKAIQLHERRLSLRETLLMTKHMSGAMCSLATELCLARLQYDSNIDFSLVVEASEKVPQPYTVTTPDSMFDNGKRTGRNVDQHTLDGRWRDSKQLDKSPPKIVPDVVKISRGRPATL